MAEKIPEITEDEWSAALAELYESPEQDESYRTVAEMAVHWGVAHETAGRRIRKMEAAGLVKRGVRYAQRAGGSWAPVAGYRPANKK